MPIAYQNDRRREPYEITDASEDRGLFKRGIVQLPMNLVPVVSTTGRGDLTVRGFVEGNVSVTVLFAGRRVSETGSIKSELGYLLAQANQSAGKAGRAPPSVNTVRLPIQMEGSWRLRFERLESGDELRHIQFVAARWAFVDRYGKTITAGKTAIGARIAVDANVP